MEKFHSWSFWKKHAHPWSGWTRFLVFPLIVWSLFGREWIYFSLSFLFLLINPVLFPEPKNKKAWMTRAVLGEQLWIQQKNSSNKITFLNVANACSAFLLIVALIHQQLVLTILGTLGVMLFKMLFIQEMVQLYDSAR